MTLTVSVWDLRAGMHLAEDLLDAHGMLLVPAGTEIDDSLIARLENFGLEQVDIAEPTLSAEEQAELSARRLEFLTRRFAIVNQDPIAQRVQAAIARYFASGAGS